MGARGKKKIWTMAEYLILAVILLFLLFPLYWVLMTSFKTNMEAYRFPPTMVPEAPNVNSYISLFTEDNFFFIYYKNNFIVSGITAAVTLVLAVMSGYALSRFKIRWNRWIVAAFLSAQMFPIVSRMISLYDLLGKIHLINTRAGLILALTAAMLPFAITLMASFFDGIPRELEEAAILDGCNRWQIYSRIMLPLTKSAMVSLAVFTALFAWKDLMWPIIVNMDMSKLTLSAGLATLKVSLSSNQGALMASSVIATFPMLILYAICQKQFIEGIAQTGMK